MTTQHLDTITRQVQKAGSPEKAAPVLFNGIADQINQSRHDPVALDKLASELRNSSTELAQAFIDAQSRGGSGARTTM